MANTIGIIDFLKKNSVELKDECTKKATRTNHWYGSRIDDVEVYKIWNETAKKIGAFVNNLLITAGLTLFFSSCLLLSMIFVSPILKTAIVMTGVVSSIAGLGSLIFAFILEYKAFRNSISFGLDLSLSHIIFTQFTR